jgi:hypothetical protein
VAVYDITSRASFEALEAQILGFLNSNQGTAGGVPEGGRAMESRHGSKVMSEKGYNVHTAMQQERVNVANAKKPPRSGRDKSPAKTERKYKASDRSEMLSSDAFDTAHGSVDYDRICNLSEENRRNVIVVGTKLDLVRKNPSLREVGFHEAKQLARRLKLAAVTELSSKDDVLLGDGDSNVTEVAACFLMTALFSYKNQVAEMRRARILAAKSRNPSSVGKHTLYPQAAVGNLQSRPPATQSEDGNFMAQMKNCFDFNEKTPGYLQTSYNGEIARYKITPRASGGATPVPDAESLEQTEQYKTENYVKLRKRKKNDEQEDKCCFSS